MLEKISKHSLKPQDENNAIVHRSGVFILKKMFLKHGYTEYHISSLSVNASK